MPNLTLTQTSCSIGHNAGDSAVLKPIYVLTSKEPMAKDTQPPVVDILIGHQTIIAI